MESKCLPIILYMDTCAHRPGWDDAARTEKRKSRTTLLWDSRRPGKKDLKLLVESNQVRIIQESQRNRLTITTSVGKKIPRTGMTLIEVMLAITILMIVLIGTSSMYVSGRRYVNSQQKYQVAAQLASQRLEQLKGAGYLGIAVGQTEEELTAAGLTCKRQTTIQLTAAPTTDFPKPCKKVTVAVTWTDVAQEDRQVKLATYIGP